ncbi:hypothetical protein KCP73_19600 [Salmonella enterica subsp. enterica]|nr:hypothetical protein KCP73_19600 [Salmonella enterica subsp. enterica]
MLIAPGAATGSNLSLSDCREGFLFNAVGIIPLSLLLIRGRPSTTSLRHPEAIGGEAMTGKEQPVQQDLSWQLVFLHRGIFLPAAPYTICSLAEVCE